MYGALLGVVENSLKESKVGHDAAQFTIGQSQAQPVLQSRSQQVPAGDLAMGLFAIGFCSMSSKRAGAIVIGASSQ
jgi:hypothetical protein